jgi:hypothetical protein
MSGRFAPEAALDNWGLASAVSASRSSGRRYLAS